MEIKRLKALFTHLDDQHLQPLRDLWRALGADYDRGDFIFMNENLFPELLGMDLPDRMGLSSFLPPDCPGIIVGKEAMQKNFYGLLNYSWSA